MCIISLFKGENLQNLIMEHKNSDDCPNESAAKAMLSEAVSPKAIITTPSSGGAFNERPATDPSKGALCKKQRTTAPQWKYFQVYQNDKDIAVCNICMVEI